MEQVPAQHEDPTASHDLQRELRGFLLEYTCGIEEIVTKLQILREEFAHLHDYNPIENISSPAEVPRQPGREDRAQGGAGSRSRPSATTVTDIAGVRVTCSFVSDVYRVFELLSPAGRRHGCSRSRDYIAEPKPNGYRSLHALVEVPVFLSRGPVPVVVEVQFRTIAMDFWASLEHKIFYQYHQEVPAALLVGLREAADTAFGLDSTMEQLHDQVQGRGDPTPSPAPPAPSPAEASLPAPRDPVEASLPAHLDPAEASLPAHPDPDSVAEGLVAALRRLHAPGPRRTRG